MAINWNDYLYGNPNATTPTRTVTNGNTTTVGTDYETLYNQAKSGNYSNFTANQTGFAPGSADFLAGYAQRNVPAQTAGMSPVSFNPLLGPEKVADPNDPIANLNKTQGEVFNEAQARYLAMATENRDLTRQGIQRTGADQYSQARMAMEQQMALSDTRGLTAGAREGAQQTLSATQQVALNQIESQTQSQLLELKQQGVQDEFLAQEYAHMTLQNLSITDPRYGKIDDLTREYQNAANTNDVDEMNRISKEISIRTEEIRTGFVSPEDQKILDNPGSSDIELSAAAERQLTRVLGDTDWLQFAASLGTVALGVAMVTGSVIAFAPTGGASSISAFKGGALIIAGLAGLGIGLVGVQRTGEDIGQAARTVEQEKARVNRILARQRRSLLARGYTNEEIDVGFQLRLASEDPVYQNIQGR